ncbi:hypothetical protein GCM10009687_73550 [Asanoa iriomotensis]|uniref:Uncharacterized protein n=1 Tax=Asanoa iriomotensis TaxID=234613 RepID=A0ABQ4BW63_9ACTN|nr:hypothetical protein Air01nite_08630 [Asanoa iriomotensis]
MTATQPAGWWHSQRQSMMVGDASAALVAAPGVANLGVSVVKTQNARALSRLRAVLGEDFARAG